jgi:hypothetical protein
MKYIPLFGEDAKNRDFTGTHWNKKFIRAIQSILNVTKGIVAPATKIDKQTTTSFFHRAFGKDINEFFEILYMPENYIVYRSVFEQKLGYTSKWREEFYNVLSDEEREEAKIIIEKNDFTLIEEKTENLRIQHFLRHYSINANTFSIKDPQYKKTKKLHDNLIKNDKFIELTLTYDFESEKPKSKRKKNLKKKVLS